MLRLIHLPKYLTELAVHAAHGVEKIESETNGFRWVSSKKFMFAYKQDSSMALPD